MSASITVWVCAACLFRLKSRHLSSRWNWASLLPRNAQIVCTHFSKQLYQFPLSITLDTWQYWISQCFFSPIYPLPLPQNANANFNWAMRQSFAGQVKAKLEEQFKQWSDKGKVSKSSTSIASCSCYCWSPHPPLSPPLPLAIVALLLSCLCQMKCSAKAACNETRC